MRSIHSLRIAACVAALMAMSGCAATAGTSGSGGSSTPAGPIVAGEVPDGAFAGHQFTLAAAGGDVQKVEMSIFNKFADKAGARVVGDSPVQLAKIQAQVQSGNVTWDVVNTLAYAAKANCGTLFERLDLSKIDLSKLPKGVTAEECGIPLTTAAGVLAYSSAAFPNGGPQTWSDFFDTKKFPGKRVLDGTNPVRVLTMALLADGVAPDKLYPLDVDRAFRKLDTIKNDVITFSTGAELQQIMESHQGAVGQVWAARVRLSNINGADWKVAPATPIIIKEVWAILKGSKNQDVAMGALNYWLGAQQQTDFQEGTAALAMNADATPKLDDQAKAVQALKPPFEPFVMIDADYWAKNLTKITDRYTTWLNG